MTHKNTDRRERLQNTWLYLIATVPRSSRPDDLPPSWWTAVESAVAGGAGALQLRAKQASTRQRCRWVTQARARLGHAALLIINDDLLAALESDADGCHLGQLDAQQLGTESLRSLAAARSVHLEGGPLAGRPLRRTSSAGFAGAATGPDPHGPPDPEFVGLQEARAQLGERLLGTSVRSLTATRLAQRAGADHVGFGDMAGSNTKGDSVRASPEELRACAQSLPTLPIFPIGGIGPETLACVIQAGVTRAAVGSALMHATDPKAVALSICERLAEARRRLPSPMRTGQM